MAVFTTRVELHGASHGDYQTLHAEMDREGFYRAIRLDDDGWGLLPTAEYFRSGELTKEEVLDSAREAAKATGKACSILVTEAAGRCWAGLQPVG